MEPDSTTERPTDRQIEAYQLVYLEGKSFKEAAAIMNASENAVYKLHQALFILRPLLKPEKGLNFDKTITYEPYMDNRVVKKW